MRQLVLLFLVCGGVGGALVTDCSQYNPQLCTMDAIIYCFTNGLKAVGTCEANKLICEYLFGSEVSKDKSCVTNEEAQRERKENGASVISHLSTLLPTFIIFVELFK